MSGQYPQLIFIAMIIGVFYFLIIRPQQKRATQQKAMIAAIRPGDEIVTIGGIFATVLSVGDRLRVRVASGAEMEIAKQAIGQVVPADATANATVAPDIASTTESEGTDDPDA